MIEKKGGEMMQGAASSEQDEWAMSERRERAVMRDLPESPAATEEPFRFPTPRGVLSKAEIEALLRPQLPTINDDENPAADAADQTYAAFEDTPPADEDEARRIASRLALALGQVAGLKASVTLRRARRFERLAETCLSAGGAPGEAFICYGDPAGDVSSVLVLPPALADCLVTTACGGMASLDAGEPRELSAIDCALLEQLTGPLCRAFAPASAMAGLETELDYVASILPEEAGEEIVFEVGLGAGRCELSLIRLNVSEAAQATAPAQPPHKRPMTVLMTARMASLSVPLSRLSSLKPGDTLLLGLPADQPVELLSGGRDGVAAFEGDVGRKGDRMAIRIRRACSDQGA